MPKYDFPKSFLFGAANSSVQIEGAVNEDGRGESIWDRFCHTPGKTFQGNTGDVACDHYHRAQEDVALMKGAGLQSYRFSIAWPRIIPDGDGAINTKGLDWYSRLVDQLLAAGIKPFASLYHWDLPQALEDKHGGWRSRKTAEAFARYAEVVVKHLGDRVKLWVPLVEMPAVVVPSYGLGFLAPGAKEPRGVLAQIQHHVLLAHGYGVRAVRQHGCRGAQVGTAYNATVFVPISETPEHVEAAQKAFVHYNGAMLESITRGRYPEKWFAGMGHDAPRIDTGDMEIIGSPSDFLGLNIYSGSVVRSTASGPAASGAAAPNPAAADQTKEYNLTFTPSSLYLVPPATAADGFAEIPFPETYPHCCGCGALLTPQALYWGIRHAAELYGYKKIYITESGCVTGDKVVNGEILDIDRILFLRLHLREVARAVAEKLPVRGYFLWSFLDSFEWSRYDRRFGLIHVDYEAQQRRTPKFSARFYASCIAARRIL